MLARVKALVEEGRALTVMGNHELNAILYHTAGSDGRPLRTHSTKNAAQHESFLETFGVMTGEAKLWTDWFLTLPLWLDLGGLRIVHACWSQKAIDLIAERRPDGRLCPEDLPEIAAESSEFGRAAKMLVSGPELKLPDGRVFHDSKGHPRTEVRIAWWRPDARNWQDTALSVPNREELPCREVPQDGMIEFYPADAPPVLVGHYKLTGRPGIEGPSAACLDYPCEPCIYHWSGARSLRQLDLQPLEWNRHSPAVR